MGYYIDGQGVIHFDTEGEGEYGFEPDHPRDVYNEHSDTGLNRIPVVVLSSFILAGFTTASGEDPYDVNEFTVNRLVEGSVVMYKGQYINHLLKVTDSFARAFNEDESYVIEFSRVNETTWHILQYNHDCAKVEDGDFTPEGSRILLDEDFPASAIKILVGDDGILMWSQRQYRQLEKRAHRLDKNMSGSALSNIILGFIGDVEQAKHALNQGKRNVFIPSKDARVERVGSTAHSDQLLREFEQMLPTYMLHCRIVDASAGANTSGLARLLKMSVMLQYVKTIRSDIKKFYAPIGVRFDALQVLPPDELIKQVAFYDALLANETINEEEHKVLCRALVA